VVWWDDAEWETQPYYAQKDVIYYRYSTDIGSASRTYYHTFFSYSGYRSIAVGGSNTAMLWLKVNLIKKAKLNFWYANTSPAGTDGAVFSINGTETRRWGDRGSWSFAEFALEPGENDIVWEKRDGLIVRGDDLTELVRKDAYFIFLDDIFVCYTE
jgi:hypothetical protein